MIRRLMAAILLLLAVGALADDYTLVTNNK
jgi:hypothetical protein